MAVVELSEIMKWLPGNDTLSDMTYLLPISMSQLIGYEMPSYYALNTYFFLIGQGRSKQIQFLAFLSNKGAKVIHFSHFHCDSFSEKSLKQSPIELESHVAIWSRLFNFATRDVTVSNCRRIHDGPVQSTPVFSSPRKSLYN